MYCNTIDENSFLSTRLFYHSRTAMSSSILFKDSYIGHSKQRTTNLVEYQQKFQANLYSFAQTHVPFLRGSMRLITRNEGTMYSLIVLHSFLAIKPVAINRLVLLLSLLAEMSMVARQRQNF